jgi:neutral ceramidase
VDDRLLAAAVEVDITPPVGTRLDGYMARQGTSVGVHDPLLAQLLLLRAGDSQVVLISMDLLGVNLDFSGQVCAGIEAAIGVPSRCTLVSCTHIHSGPAGFWPHSVVFPAAEDPELTAVARRKLVGAALWAQESLRPASVGIGHGYVEGIGTNRNDPEMGAVDGEVLVLRVDDLQGRPLAVMLNYGCHPTVLGYQNLLFSADYPGATRAALRRIYPGTVFLCTNGAAGDISTRFTRRDQSFAEVERLGRILAGEVLKVMQVVDRQESNLLDGRTTPVELRFRPFPAAEEAKSELKRLQENLEKLKANQASHGEIRRATTRVEGATVQAQMAQALSGRTGHSTLVQVLQVGDVALVGLPGEPFTRTVLEIKELSPHPHTAVLSYSNDEAGYFPDAASVTQGTYEALISPFGPDVAERLREAALSLLHEA